MTIELTHEQAATLRTISLGQILLVAPPAWLADLAMDGYVTLKLRGVCQWSSDITDIGRKALADYDAKCFVISAEAAQLQAIVGCADGGCIWRRPTGMCTNGGCSCEKDLRRRLKALGYSLTDTMRFVSAIRNVRDEIREGKG